MSSSPRSWLRTCSGRCTGGAYRSPDCRGPIPEFGLRGRAYGKKLPLARVRQKSSSADMSRSFRIHHAALQRRIRRHGAAPVRAALRRAGSIGSVIAMIVVTVASSTPAWCCCGLHQSFNAVLALVGGESAEVTMTPRVSSSVATVSMSVVDEATPCPYCRAAAGAIDIGVGNSVDGSANGANAEGERTSRPMSHDDDRPCRCHERSSDARLASSAAGDACSVELFTILPAFELAPMPGAMTADASVVRRFQPPERIARPPAPAQSLCALHCMLTV